MEDVELDEYDREALHIVVKEGRRIVGVAMVVFLADNKAKAERMTIRKFFQRREIGRNTISFLHNG